MSETAAASPPRTYTPTNVANPPLIVINGVTGFIGNVLFLTLFERLKTSNPEHYRYCSILSVPYHGAGAQFPGALVNCFSSRNPAPFFHLCRSTSFIPSKLMINIINL